MKPVLPAVVAVISLVSPASAMTWATFNNLPTDAQLVYSMGVTQGLQFANVHLSQEGSQRIFCEPEGTTISPDQMLALAISSGVQADAKYPVELMLMEELRTTFPCK